MLKLLRRKRESCRACAPIEPWLFRYTTKIRTRRVHPLPFGSRTTRRPAGAAGGPEASIVARVTIRCRAYHYAQRICTVYNFHAYTLRFRCLPGPWRARAWRARRLKKGRHWRRRRTLLEPYRATLTAPCQSRIQETAQFSRDLILQAKMVRKS